MGTRNLTIVISNGQTKIAQYGQWDGYPSGQGLTALEFLRKADINLFKEKVDKLRWLTDEEGEAIGKDANWRHKYPYLHRDMGAKILEYVNSHEILGLANQELFAADSLMNEWTYVVDLDRRTFEVYEGFNKSPLPEDERFASLAPAQYKIDAQYYPVKLKKVYLLNSLPGNETFLAECEGSETEIEAD